MTDATFETPGTERRIRRRGAGQIGSWAIVAAAALWLGLVLIGGVGAEWIAPYDFAAIDLRARLQPPAWLETGTLSHLLGTDDLGRDVFSRLLHSVRTSLLIALAGTVIGAVIGTTLGMLAARFRGPVETLIMTLADFQSAMPTLILALMFLAIFPPNFYAFLLLVGLHGWDRYARIVRGLVLSTQAQGYVVALDLVGAGSWRIYLLHILPNILNAIIVGMTLNFPEVILLESSLSFLGLGVQPPLTSLGNMVGFGRDFILSAWWIAAIPATVIFCSALTFGFLGDWLRDRLDPHLRT